ncbi:hypothetical protein O181_047849 [Austropuccinia psidii MF-1]|uniref:Uncharacterized protein n=1 Tax=Austropuccinia psidii MF-1 TaxID=1389203 RepID=A0A9Q3HMF4_9BASI|nr:hypothetical protein [Austropuccinia psidii MF-1]
MANGSSQRGTFDSPTNVAIAGDFKLAIICCNTSNLNKHRGQCCGRFNAWSSKAPGAVDPNMGAKLAAEEQESILNQLVKGLVAIQVSFSIFKLPQLRSVLQQLAPKFHWPKHQLVSQTALQLYFKCKDGLLKEVNDLPSDTQLCGAIDCWTTKDQSKSYLAIVLQWINAVDYNFCKSIVDFEVSPSQIFLAPSACFNTDANHTLETFNSNLYQHAPDRQLPLNQRSLEHHGIHGAHPSNVQSSMQCISKQITFKTPRASILPGNTQSAHSLCKQEPPFVEASM